MHINAIIYIRVSTSDQKSGKDTQLDVITQKIQSLGYRQILQTFTDEEVSGDSHIHERPAFKELIKYIEEFNLLKPNDPIKELWVQTRDRISRAVDMLGYAVVLLRDLGVEIRATEESDEMLVTRIYDMLGEEELKKYRQKRVYGIKRRINEQKVLSRAPFGYKIENDKLVVDESLRPRIIQIFQMFEDNVTMSTICNKFSIPRSTLAYMRKNPIYITGEYTWKGKVIYTVEPVIREGDIKQNDEENFYS